MKNNRKEKPVLCGTCTASTLGAGLLCPAIAFGGGGCAGSVLSDSVVWPIGHFQRSLTLIFHEESHACETSGLKESFFSCPVLRKPEKRKSNLSPPAPKAQTPQRMHEPALSLDCPANICYIFTLYLY